MSQCIRLGCKAEAWTDPEIPSRRSYFCLKDAWLNVRGHLVLTPPQLEVYNNEGFEECLKDKFDFPIPWLRKHLTGNPRPSLSILDFPTCGNCGRTIVNGAKHCGNCRRELGLPLDETQVKIVRCFNYGKELDRECKKDLPITEARRPPDGRFWCGPCLIKVASQSPEWRQEFGYEF